MKLAKQCLIKGGLSVQDFRKLSSCVIEEMYNVPDGELQAEGLTKEDLISLIDSNAPDSSELSFFAIC